MVYLYPFRGLLQVIFVDYVVPFEDTPVLWPEIIIATLSGTPALTIFLTAVLLKS